jgi:TBC1 domain family member 20
MSVPDSDSVSLHRRAIHNSLLSERVDLKYLRNLSRSPGGFLDSKLRAQIWPKLLGINRYNIPDFKAHIFPHKDDSQVRVDIDRSLWSYCDNKDWIDQYRERRRQALSDIMSAILCRNPRLHYYQGFHDIVSVCLLVLKDDHLAFAVAEIISIRYLMDFLAKGTSLSSI